jgi:hypothetical protein
MDFESISHGLWINLAWTLNRFRMDFGSSRTDFGSRSHGLWIEVARTLDRGRTDFGSRSHGLWVEVAGTLDRNRMDFGTWSDGLWGEVEYPLERGGIGSGWHPKALWKVRARGRWGGADPCGMNPAVRLRRRGGPLCSRRFWHAFQGATPSKTGTRGGRRCGSSTPG